MKGFTLFDKADLRMNADIFKWADLQGSLQDFGTAARRPAVT